MQLSFSTRVATQRDQDHTLCVREWCTHAGCVTRRTCMPTRMALPSCSEHQARPSASHPLAAAHSHPAAKAVACCRSTQTPARDARTHPQRATRIQRASQTFMSQSQPMYAGHPRSHGKSRDGTTQLHARTSPSTECNETSAHAGATESVVRVDGPGKNALQLPSSRSAASIISKTRRLSCGGFGSTEAETLSVEPRRPLRDNKSTR